MTTRTKVLVITLPLLAAAVALVLYLRVAVDTSIPEDSEVESITASLFSLPTGDPDVPEFVVPPQHIAEIMKKLRPAEKRSYPDWRDIGQLTIRRKDGRTTIIRFPGPAVGPLAFTINSVQHVRGEKIVKMSDESMVLTGMLLDIYQGTLKGKH